MKKVIFLSAGHTSTGDPGTTTQFGKETDFNMAIRDALIPELVRNGFEVKKVPDDLDLRGSIEWVNQRSSNIEDGLALEIHCNCCKGEGSETYYYGNYESSKKIAKLLIDEYCKETGLKNRGAKSDGTTRFGALSWIRETIPVATLIEVGFLDSKNDVEKLKDYKKIARGICLGVCAIYKIEYIPESSPQPKIKEEIKPEPSSQALGEIIEVLKKYKLI